MGNYNPHAPLVLGQQWVPIRDQPVIYSPLVNSVERGQGFSLTANQQVRDARFYVADMPAELAIYQVAQVNLYPYGLEDLTGPIQQVIIPCKSVGATGNNMSLVGVGSPGLWTEALYQPGDNKYVTVNVPSSGSQTLAMFFDVSSYPVLANKRILNVSFVYSGSVQDTGPNGLPIDFVHPPDGTSLTLLSQSNDAGQEQQFPSPVFDQGGLGSLYNLNTLVQNAGSALNGAPIAYVDIGDVNNGWNTAAIGNTTEKLPWRYVDLLRFEPSSANRQFLKLSFSIPLTENGFPAGSGNDVQLQLNYAALRVIYCEERRVAYGAQQLGYSYGMNAVTLRDLSQTADPTFGAGIYLPTLSMVSMGQVGFGFGLNGDFPNLNGVEQLYEIPSHPAVEVDIPTPLADHLDETFTRQASNLLPQLTLHSPSGTAVQPHAYGQNGWAQVFGQITATQEIYDDISGVNQVYPQVRFYARRFGDTTIPLTLTGTGVFAGNTVSIDAATFDALPEILGGAREVTLRFVNPPTLGAATGTPGWVWSAIGEAVGNRWEVLLAAAPAISGVPGTRFTQVPSPNQLGAGTYQPPSGATVELTWMPQGITSIWVTGSTIDAASDAVLMFSQDPNQITGHSLTARTQAISGIGAFCGSLPCCIPSGIAYNQITWPAWPGASLVRDSFNRTVVTGLGNPDVGTGPYALTDVGSAYSVNGSEARITPATGFVTDFATLNVGSPDFDITVEGGEVGNVASGTSSRMYVTGRYTDANNNYAAFIQYTQASGATVLAIEKTVVGATSNLVVITPPITFNAGGRIWMRFMGYGGGGVGAFLKVKVWAGDLEAEPTMWHIETNDTSLTTGNRAGIGAQSRGAGNDNTVAFDSLLITPPAYYFGGYELQRWDPATGGDFQTIMLSTDITTTTFNDFEARVGQTSVYRIRNINAYNFAGLWSTQISGAPPTPGITGGCADMTGALIFTANADQSGASNAAYIMQWDGTPAEGFDMPEAGQVQYQPLYGRDGVVAFHGTERGLETFSRNVLLAAGAISLPSLADGQDIRDLAWATLPYVCVRDGRGNRWYSSIRIPTITARNDAQSYITKIDIVETTLTPYPVDT